MAETAGGVYAGEAERGEAGSRSAGSHKNTAAAMRFPAEEDRAADGNGEVEPCLDRDGAAIGPRRQRDHFHTGLRETATQAFVNQILFYSGN